MSHMIILALVVHPQFVGPSLTGVCVCVQYINLSILKMAGFFSTCESICLGFFGPRWSPSRPSSLQLSDTTNFALSLDGGGRKFLGEGSKLTAGERGESRHDSGYEGLSDRESRCQSSGLVKVTAL